MDNNLKTTVGKAMGQIERIYAIVVPGDDGSQSTLRSQNIPLRQKILEIITSSLFWVSFVQNRKKVI